MVVANPPVTASTVKQQDAKPTRKVIAGGVAGSLATIIVFVLNTYVIPDKPITAEIAVALTAILSFLISYIVPPAASDQIERTPVI